MAYTFIRTIRLPGGISSLKNVVFVSTLGCKSLEKSWSERTVASMWLSGLHRDSVPEEAGEGSRKSRTVGQ